MLRNIVCKLGWFGFLPIMALILGFALSQGVEAQGPEGTPVAAPGSSQMETGGEQLPIEPESLPSPSAQSADQPETYIGPEGELLYTHPLAIQAQQVLTGTLPITTTAGAYVNISASNFPPREAGTTKAYGGAGCSYRTSSSGYFTTHLQLPKGAKIITIRAQYYDAATEDGTVYLYSYNGGGQFQLLGKAVTEGTTGYGSTYSPAIDHTIDNENESLALILDYATVSDSSLRFCNIRVTYTWEVNLPMVAR
ncbi:MAG: hypothetical protein P8Z00_15850 [Anaerolineales bacterium]|jgi:hypothetical protein